MAAMRRRGRSGNAQKSGGHYARIPPGPEVHFRLRPLRKCPIGRRFSQPDWKRVCGAAHHCDAIESPAH